MEQQQLVDGEGWISDDSSLYGEDKSALGSSYSMKAAGLSERESSAGHKGKSLKSAKVVTTSMRGVSSPALSRTAVNLDRTSLANETSPDLVSNGDGSSCWEIERFRGHEAAWQQTETIDEFVTRLPVNEPATASVGPWLWVGNPLTPRKQQRSGSKSDILSLLREGSQRLDEFVTRINKGEGGNKTASQKQLRDDLVSLGAKHGVTAGKWMLFPSIEHLSNVWRKVAEATAAGKLGHCSKVGTFEHGRSNILICVYTYDCRDTQDIGKVLRNLEDLDVVRRVIYYKCDAYTHLDIDSNYPGNFRASLFSNRDFVTGGSHQPTIDAFFRR